MTIHRGRRKAIAQLLSVSSGVALGIPRVAFAQPAKPASIVVNAAGGAVNKGLREAFFNEFEKRYGIKVVDTSPTDFGKLRAMVQSGNVEWSVMEINEADAERAVKLNLLEPLDMSVINMAGHPKELQDNKWVVTRGIYSTVLGYRTDVFASRPRPTTWAEFWDVKKFPGPRALRNSPVDNLEFALMADGVKPNELYPIRYRSRVSQDGSDQTQHLRLVDDWSSVRAVAHRQGGGAGNSLARQVLHRDQGRCADRH